MKKTLLTALKGFCMGSADVIPGVSGGTMAFILGIYQRLIDAIRSFDLVWLQALLRLDGNVIIRRPDLGFLLPLFTGIVLALLFFTRVVPVPRLLEVYPEPVYSLFFGLILASIAYLFRGFDHWRARDSLVLVTGIVLGWLVFTLIPVETPDATWFLFLSGALAICAMLLPGISGSFILLILKKYSTVFTAIGYFNMAVLLPFALGAVTGLAVFSRVLSLLLHRCYRATVVFIIGLLVASLWVIWPYQQRLYESFDGRRKLIASTPVLPSAPDATFWLCVILFLTGCLAVYVIHRLAREKTVRGEE
jgi:putative membrane protein